MLESEYSDDAIVSSTSVSAPPLPTGVRVDTSASPLPTGVWADCARRAISMSAGTSTNVFDVFMRVFDEYYYSENATTMGDLKRRKGANVRKGAEFEGMCCTALRAGFLVSGVTYTKVHRFPDLTSDQRVALGLVDASGAALAIDSGIDAVAMSSSGVWDAFQFKYRKKSAAYKTPVQARMVTTATGGTIGTTGGYMRSSWSINWQELGTFIGLCSTTGPRPMGWGRYVMVTNSQGVKHKGTASPKYKTIAYGTWCALTLDQWKTMCGDDGHLLGGGDYLPSDMTVVATNPQPTGAQTLKSGTPRKRATKPAPKTLRAAREGFLASLTTTQ